MEKSVILKECVEHLCSACDDLIQNVAVLAECNHVLRTVILQSIPEAADTIAKIVMDRSLEKSLQGRNYPVGEIFDILTTGMDANT